MEHAQQDDFVPVADTSAGIPASRMPVSSRPIRENVKREETIGRSRIEDSEACIDLLDTKRDRMVDATRPNGLLRERIDKAQNDRDIPRFLHDELEQVLGISHLERPSSFHSKAVQTRISGVRTISNFLYTNDFGHPVTIVNSSTSPKDPSSCITHSSELSMTRSHLYNVHSNYQKLKLRFHKLHQDFYKLIEVAGELTIALDNSVRGKPVDLPATLESCMNVYPDLFNHNVREDSTETKSMRSEIELQHHDLTESKQPILGIIPVSSKQFDFKKIKLHLINGNVKTKLLLLQALRWKITLSQPAERDEAIHEYTSSDLLGLHGQLANDSGKSILPYLLVPLDVVLPHPLQQSAARLLNTLASLRCGRDYLSVGPTVLNVVVQCLDTARVESIDAFTCDMILAMLQKMSLRRQQRLYMIGMGLVEWLIYHLKSESKKIGTYRLEYTTALLMNLSLHREAQVRVSTMTTLVLSTLTELLSSSHTAALPYVNGTLNNFLANRTINEEAKKIGLDAVLEYHRKRNSGEIRRHLDYILKRLARNSNESIEDNTVMADDDREELDVLENELDELDPVKVHAGELFGEALLATCYSITPTTNPITSHSIVDSKESLSKSSDLSNSDSQQQTDEIVDKDSHDFSSYERIISPSTNAPRLTPSSRRLTKKNTTSLKVIEVPQKSIVKIKRLLVTVDKSVEAIDDAEISSESEIDFTTEYSDISRSTDPSFHGLLSANRNVKDSSATAVNSATWISAYESGAEVNEDRSSVASLIIENDGTADKEKKSETRNDNREANVDDAFLSKPRITRTPPPGS